MLITAISGTKSHRNKLAQQWCAQALGMLGIEVKMQGVIKPGCLHVANHITWLDVAVMMSVGCRGFVSKSEVAQWSVVGPLVKSVDTVFIERGAWKTEEARDVMTERLRRGQSVLFFPEGTTSDGRQVRRFHARLFEAALSSGKPVQALAIRYEVQAGDYDAIPYINNVRFVENIVAVTRQPKIIVHLIATEPLRCQGFDRKGLAEAARQKILAELASNKVRSDGKASVPEAA